MNDKKTQVSLMCLFCTSDQFVIPEDDYQPQSGDLLRCANCGKVNDYDSLMRVIQRKATEWAEEQAQDLLHDFSKQIGKSLN